MSGSLRRGAPGLHPARSRGADGPGDLRRLSRQCLHEERRSHGLVQRDCAQVAALFQIARPVVHGEESHGAGPGSRVSASRRRSSPPPRAGGRSPASRGPPPELMRSWRPRCPGRRVRPSRRPTRGSASRQSARWRRRWPRCSGGRPVRRTRPDSERLRRRSGRRTQKVLPAPGRLRTPISPPYGTRSPGRWRGRANAPVRCPDTGVGLLEALEDRLRSFRCDPAPAVHDFEAERVWISSLGSGRARSKTAPCDVNLTAFPIRLMRTWRILVTSPRTAWEGRDRSRGRARSSCCARRSEELQGLRNEILKDEGACGARSGRTRCSTARGRC